MRIQHCTSPWHTLQATRDFAVEAAQLSEALAQKEEEVQMTGEHHALSLSNVQTCA